VKLAPGLPHQSHRLTRRAHPGLDLGAHRHPLDEPPQRFHQERIPLVAAIEAHSFAKQAGRNPEPDAWFASRHC
jgi:hypothetical protein